jgi:hypothetical protein
MNRSTLQSIHKYGSILSLVAIAIAIIAYVVGGPNSVIGLFGLLGPPCAFYFIGAHLYYTSTYRVVGGELMRGVAWYFFSLVGWSLLISQTSALSATPFTMVGLPAFTALGITFVMVGSRKVTGLDLKIKTESGQLLQLILGTIVFGFVALYLSLTEEFGWWAFGLYLGSIPVGLALRRVLKKRYPDALSVN